VTESTPSSPFEQTWKLTIAYDGTEFRGWQVQPGERTVQGEIQAALGRITGQSPLPQGSGRTDAGVHALAQVASFSLSVRIPPENLQRALNRTLPASIRISECIPVRSTFHARHSAAAKTYEYRVFPEKTSPNQPSRICPPFLAPFVYACPWSLNLNMLDEAARHFVGEHDFLSFAATDPDLATRRQALLDNLHAINEVERKPQVKPSSKSETAIRTIFSSVWERRQTSEGDLLVYRVRGSGFLHHMVRNLVGTQLDIGRGRLRAAQIPSMFAARDRSAAGPTAPACGLFLHSVEYDGAD